METEITTAACPGCARPLTRVLGVDGVMAGCDGCGAMWLDNLACRLVLDGLISELGKEFLRAVTDAARAAAAGGYRQPAPREERQCPVCQARLAARVANEPRITVDCCGPHGTSFDRGELKALSFETEMRVAAADAEIAANAADAAYRGREAALHGLMSGVLAATFRR